MDYRKLIDLFLDDELPLELQLEFKQAMFADSDLSAEVSEARRVRERVIDAFEGDSMTDEERQRVYGRIVAELASSDPRVTQPNLPLSGQFQLPIQG